MANLSLNDLLGFAHGAGFSGQNANIAAAIAMAESGGNPNAINWNDPGGSYGLTQINGASWGNNAASTLGNPAEAFSQMFNISGGGSNFTPWSTFNNGSYLPFLSQLAGGSSSGGGGIGGLDLGGLTTGGIGSLVGQQLGSQPVTDALGNQTSGSASPMSQIFAAIDNFFQRSAFVVFGIILVGIGIYFVAKPKVIESARGAIRRSAAAAVA